jgi:hypothetical protein
MQGFRSCRVQLLPEKGNEGEPINGPLMQEGFLKDLKLEFLEKYSIFVQSLYTFDCTFSKFCGETQPLCSGSYLARL